MEKSTKAVLNVLVGLNFVSKGSLYLYYVRDTQPRAFTYNLNPFYVLTTPFSLELAFARQSKNFPLCFQFIQKEKLPCNAATEYVNKYQIKLAKS